MSLLHISMVLNLEKLRAIAFLKPGIWKAIIGQKNDKGTIEGVIVVGASFKNQRHFGFTQFWVKHWVMDGHLGH